MELSANAEEVDVVTGATSLATAAQELERASGNAGAAGLAAPPPVTAAPGASAAAGGADAASAMGAQAKPDAQPSPFAVLKRGESDEVDAATGATPGVASACKEFGMSDSAAFAAARGIKPPGQA